MTAAVSFTSMLMDGQTRKGVGMEASWTEGSGSIVSIETNHIAETVTDSISNEGSPPSSPWRRHGNAWTRIRTPSPESYHPGAHSAPSPTCLPMVLLPSLTGGLVTSMINQNMAASPTSSTTASGGTDRTGQSCASLVMSSWPSDRDFQQKDVNSEWKGTLDSVMVDPSGAAVVVSIGTVGHPHSCAEPCRYIRRKGGCRDGEACSLCHYCQWRRRGGKVKERDGAERSSAEVVGSRQQPAHNPAGPAYGQSDSQLASVPPPPTPSHPRPTRQASQGHVPAAVCPVVQQPADVPEEPAASIGSKGHPYNCGSACKYIRRKTGCRDGANCMNCHECRWTRKSFNSKEASSPQNGMSGAGKDEVDDASVSETQSIAMNHSQSMVFENVYDENEDYEHNGGRHVPYADFTLSEGSKGHPCNCQAPCKYNHRPRGCKDGATCSHCHLCTFNKRRAI
mmetsp:Transcript_5418/g.13135  ORF Transcript_5418/g.13135 Transcript_5418/m.13135 type:complete len:452 (+) Transcript_5418:179-1534(+)